MRNVRAGARHILHFFNSETRETTAEDPGLESFSEHKDTGKIIKYDPRLELEALSIPNEENILGIYDREPPVVLLAGEERSNGAVNSSLLLPKWNGKWLDGVVRRG
ncbi:hypothetical protein L207DRAFT_524895 [Hyaloscypha variabilis F]|uniref:Uncharacterized protein n=1 Tax=Hyaloscypha variabilis (strain UAMH 11265 / GT02V1 / F) TaxID=1149755 RepID=A0A2J6S476_HYAVF|nr:hypothetical protein L207DRAFT_524895 [Hyaloscypha variabilis F]